MNAANHPASAVPAERKREDQSPRIDASNYARLRHTVVEDYPGFGLHLKTIGNGSVALVDERSTTKVYLDFRDALFSRLGTGRHTPVFRMSHGEFWFSCGHRLAMGSGLRDVCAMVWGETRRRLGVIPQVGYAKGNHTAECLYRGDIRRLMPDYTRQIQSIAERGWLAIAFQANRSFIEYRRPLCRWLDEAGVRLSPSNYVPFYAVYALLCGPDARTLFGGRDVLVVTSIKDDRADRLDSGLRNLGARSVQVLPVSASRAICERLDLSQIRQRPEVILVGGGIGSANLIEQVEPLGAVAIDSGFATDAIAYDAMRGRRPFTLPDSEFHPDRIGFLEGERRQSMFARWRDLQGTVR